MRVASLPWRRILANALPVAALLLPAPASANDQARMSAVRSGSSVDPVIIFAIDGLERSLLKRLTSRGECPNFAKLLKEGASGYLVSNEESKSPVIWTTIATGQPSSEHGITDFFVDGVLATSSRRRKLTFWEIASRYGLKVAMVGWYVTWPATEVDGYLVSDRAEFFQKIPRPVWPPLLRHWMGRYWIELAGSDLKRFTPARFDPSYQRKFAKGTPAYDRNFLLQDRLVTVLKRDRGYARLGLELIEDKEVRLFALYLRGIDFTSHGFWKYFKPSYFPEVTEADVKALGGIIPSYYRYVDEILGQYLRLLPANSTVIVLSDHGFGPAVGRWSIAHRTLRYLSGSHRRKGVFVIWGKHAAGGGAAIGVVNAVDLLPTLLHLLGLPQARDLPGRLVTEALDRKLAAKETHYIESYEEEARPGGRPPRSAADREIERQLRSLGYIE